VLGHPRSPWPSSSRAPAAAGMHARGPWARRCRHEALGEEAVGREGGPPGRGDTPELPGGLAGGVLLGPWRSDAAQLRQAAVVGGYRYSFYFLRYFSFLIWVDMWGPYIYSAK
jgi:hypothetical protein